MPPKTAMIVVTKPNKVLKIIPEVKRYLKNTLYILLLSENKMQNLNVDNNVLLNKKQQHNLGSASKYSSSVVGLYKDTFYTNLEVRVLLSGLREPFSTDIHTKIPIEVIYIDHLLNRIDFKKLLTSQITNKMSDCEVISVNNEDKSSASNSMTNSVGPQSEIVYNNVVLGGTFDRLHVGHKILLSEAVLHCQKKLTVGVTDTDMLKTKTLWELIEPCSVRMQNVKDFLQEVEPRLEYDVVPINDIYGPTKDDPDFEMIVVSAETIKGGDKINQVRKENGLSQMAVYSVPLLPELNKADVIEEDKVSSSNNRLRLLGTLLKPPTLKLHLPKVPYRIGLSGGITSGKSGISKYLEELGASIINADLLGHRVYEVGTTCYKLVVDHFGQKVVSDNGEINRKVLGEIVFSDKDQLQKLNSLVWPAILELLRKEIAKLGESGSKVVVTEAAVLLQANWINEFHEIWTAIVPPEEAIKRLKERNLTEEEAKKRLSSQPSNTEQLEVSDVVFCTLWNPRYTQKQVVRAWDELQSRLGFNNTEQSNDTLINKG